jgi:hypothetical protein
MVAIRSAMPQAEPLHTQDDDVVMDVEVGPLGDGVGMCPHFAMASIYPSDGLRARPRS